MNNLVRLTMGLSIVMFLGACTSASPALKEKDNKLSLVGKTVYVKSAKANYSLNSDIAQNIKDECNLDSQLITAIQNEAKKKDITVKVSESIPADGVELKVEITDSMSAGNGFTGHRKYSSISGVLTQSGQTIATMNAARLSRGGMFAKFQGSCGVLSRTVRTLGGDVTQWMAKPSTDASYGDIALIPRN